MFHNTHQFAIAIAIAIAGRNKKSRKEYKGFFIWTLEGISGYQLIKDF